MVGLVAQDEVEGVDERAAVVGGAGANRLDDLGRERLQRGVMARDAAREGGELAQVGQADRPARAGEQPDERRPGARVAHDPQRGDDVDHLGRRQQPAEPEDAVRDAAAAERVAEADHVLLAAEQDRARRGRAAPRPRRPRTRSNHPATRSASASRSPSKPNSTSPAGAPGRGRSPATGTGADAASGASTAFAASSTRALLRQLVSSEYCAHGTPGENAAEKPPRLPALAPRQP